MAPVLYLFYTSPSCRAVLMTAKALGITLNEKVISLYKNDHLTSEYLEMNPQHTVPTLKDDDGFVVWDSNAIMPYLISKSGRNCSLYPKDLKIRATIDQLLYFNSGSFYTLTRDIIDKVIFEDYVITEKEEKLIFDHFYVLEDILKKTDFVAGNFVTIADYSLVATATSFDSFLYVDPDIFPNVTRWIERCQDLPEYVTLKKSRSSAFKQRYR